MPVFTHSSRRHAVALAVAVLVSLLSAGTRASTAVSIYTAAARVDMLPAESTATEVVIHGAFMFLDSSGNYSDAVCGTMYFRCPSGSETMCRMQWLDIRSMGTASNQCAGFGSVNAVSSAHVRAEGTALVSPDTWDLGVGVQPGSFIGGKCGPAKRLACAQPGSVDGGAIDAPTTTDGKSSVDGQVADGPAWTEAGLRDVRGVEDGAKDMVDVDTANTRDAASVSVDMANPDVPATADSASADVYVASAGPDAGADKNVGATEDASAGKKDAAVAESLSDGNGCGCWLGGAHRRGGGSGPMQLIVLTALFGFLGLRRKRR